MVAYAAVMTTVTGTAWLHPRDGDCRRPSHRHDEGGPLSASPQVSPEQAHRTGPRLTAPRHDPQDPAVFRRVLGTFATGVVVLATCDGEGTPHGMAVNSFTSVSLDPPLVAFCAARSSTTWPHLRRVGAFTVSVLADGHEHLARTFAAREVDRFAHLHWASTPDGQPALADALAVLECRTEVVHDAGDHELVVARVLAVALADPDARPLLFFRGRYASLAP